MIKTTDIELGKKWFFEFNIYGQYFKMINNNKTIKKSDIKKQKLIQK